jgi:3-methyladenine DNA glycosylase AlkD
MSVARLQKRLRELQDPRTALFLQKFFKTGPGEYGDGDLFRGIRVPILRKLAKEFGSLTLAETKKLLRSPYHEDRLLALLILTRAYLRGDEPLRERIFNLYINNTQFINNWDLVDSSAPQIVGGYLWDKNRDVLYGLARSRQIWERRIAIMATFHFLKRDEYTDTLKIAGVLLFDSQNLIHKAVGWMLREVGNRNREVEEKFLRKHYEQMPRVMLRYAIEKFPETRRQQYLRGAV